MRLRDREAPSGPRFDGIVGPVSKERTGSRGVLRDSKSQAPDRFRDHVWGPRAILLVLCLATVLVGPRQVGAADKEATDPSNLGEAFPWLEVYAQGRKSIEGLKSAGYVDEDADSADITLLVETAYSLLDAARRRDIEPQFWVLRDDGPNAWSFGGGKFAVSSGLLTRLSHDEIAYIVGHELAHELLNHHQRDLERCRAVTEPGVLGELLAADATELQDEELEADAMGMRLAAAAGFPLAAAYTGQWKLSEYWAADDAATPSTGEAESSHPIEGRRLRQYRKVETRLRQVQILFDAGLDLCSGGAEAEGVSLLEQYLAIFPSDSHARTNAGLCLLGGLLEDLSSDGYLDVLPEYLDRGVVLRGGQHPGDMPNAWQVRWKRARTLLELGAKDGDQNHVAAAALSILARHEGELAAALTRIDEAIGSAGEESPAAAGYHSNRGVILTQQAKHGEAEDAFRLAVDLEPALEAAWDNWTTGLEQSGKAARARRVKRFRARRVPATPPGAAAPAPVPVGLRGIRPGALQSALVEALGRPRRSARTSGQTWRMTWGAGGRYRDEPAVVAQGRGDRVISLVVTYREAAVPKRWELEGGLGVGLSREAVVGLLGLPSRRGGRAFRSSGFGFVYDYPASGLRVFFLADGRVGKVHLVPTDAEQSELWEAFEVLPPLGSSPDAVTVPDDPATPAPLFVHCHYEMELQVRSAEAVRQAPFCPFELAPDEEVLVPEGVNAWPLPADSQARSTMEAAGERDLSLLVSAETAPLFAQGLVDEGLAAIATALSERPGHIGLQALEEIWLRALGRSEAGAEAAPGEVGRRNVFGRDDRQPVYSSKMPYSAVGFLNNGCTGTLVSQWHVLTAGHCLVSSNGVPATYFTPNAGVDSRSYRIARHRTWSMFRPSPNGGSNDTDLAILELEAAAGDIHGWFGLRRTSEGSISPGTSFHQIGYSGDVWSSSRRATAVQNCRVREVSGNSFLHDCDTKRGDSGSPLYKMESGHPILYAVVTSELRYGSNTSLTRRAYSPDYANLAIRTAPAFDALMRLKRSHRRPTPRRTPPKARPAPRRNPPRATPAPRRNPPPYVSQRHTNVDDRDRLVVSLALSGSVLPDPNLADYPHLPSGPIGTGHVGLDLRVPFAALGGDEDEVDGFVFGGLNAWGAAHRPDPLLFSLSGEERNRSDHSIHGFLGGGLRLSDEKEHDLWLGLGVGIQSSSAGPMTQRRLAELGHFVRPARTSFGPLFRVQAVHLPDDWYGEVGIAWRLDVGYDFAWTLRRHSWKPTQDHEIGTSGLTAGDRWELELADPERLSLFGMEDDRFWIRPELTMRFGSDLHAGIHIGAFGRIGIPVVDPARRAQEPDHAPRVQWEVGPIARLELTFELDDLPEPPRPPGWPFDEFALSLALYGSLLPDPNRSDYPSVGSGPILSGSIQLDLRLQSGDIPLFVFAGLSSGRTVHKPDPLLLTLTGEDSNHSIHGIRGFLGGGLKLSDGDNHAFLVGLGIDMKSHSSVPEAQSLLLENGYFVRPARISVAPLLRLQAIHTSDDVAGFAWRVEGGYDFAWVLHRHTWAPTRDHVVGEGGPTAGALWESQLAQEDRLSLSAMEDDLVWIHPEVALRLGEDLEVGLQIGVFGKVGFPIVDPDRQQQELDHAPRVLWDLGPFVRLDGLID